VRRDHIGKLPAKDHSESAVSQLVSEMPRSLGDQDATRLSMDRSSG
jgi:hypothetical protein